MWSQSACMSNVRTHKCMTPAGDTPGSDMVLVGATSGECRGLSSSDTSDGDPGDWADDIEDRLWLGGGDGG